MIWYCRVVFNFKLILSFFRESGKEVRRGFLESKGFVKNLRFRSEENVYILEVKESWFCNFNFVRVSFKCLVDN